jgi:hypothetical protein
MKQTDDIDIDRLVSELRRVAEKLERLSRRTTTVESLIVDALGSLGPLSAYRLVKVTRRGRARVYAGLRSLAAAGRIKRTRTGWSLVEVALDASTDPPVDPQIDREVENREPPRQ